MPKQYEYYGLSDWAAVYVDGNLVAQGHSINIYELLEGLGYKEASQSASEEAINNESERGYFGHFPETLDELVAEFGLDPEKEGC